MQCIIIYDFLHEKHDAKMTLQLVIPETMVEQIISRYHDDLLNNHQVVMRTYLTIPQHFYMRNMFNASVIISKLVFVVRNFERSQINWDNCTLEFQILIGPLINLVLSLRQCHHRSQDTNS